MAQGGRAAERCSWKEYAGRERGPDSYQFGDLARHLWRALCGGGIGPEAVSARHGAGLIDDDDCALLDLKAQRDQLVGHRRRVEKMLVRDEEGARAFVQSGKKEQAMLTLRKKKLHQQLLADCEGHVNKIDELIDNIEASRLQRDTVAALQAGVATMKRLQREIGGADYVEKLMDDFAEAADVQRELNEALSGAGVAADDADALAELAKLEEAHAASLLAEAASAGASAGTAPASVLAAGAAAPAAAGAPAAAAAPVVGGAPSAAVAQAPASRTPVPA